MGVTHSSHKLQPEDILSIQKETGFTSSQIDRLYTRLIFYLMKGVFAQNYPELKSISSAKNFTSICCVYKEKLVYNDSYRRA